MQIVIAKYRPEDCEALATMFYETVHTINAKDYTVHQLLAWAPEVPDLEQWNRSLLSHIAFTAWKDGRPVGFGDIDTDGYLDRLYVHEQYQGQGIAALLCDRLEAQVRVKTIVVHASITAKGFFEKRGYEVIKEQQVPRRGQLLTNYIMNKTRDVQI